MQAIPILNLRVHEKSGYSNMEKRVRAIHCIESESVSFVLRYTTSEGTQSETEFDKEARTIDLSNKDIIGFDTSQLVPNNQVKELLLDGNNISRLDLTPLLSCKNLQTIELDYETDGETILSDSVMEKLADEVLYDEITNFDALSYLPSLDSIRYSFPYVRKREQIWKLIHLFQNALDVLGLGGMGILDIGIKESERILKEILKTGCRDEIKETLMTALIEQIDRGGPTINLDVEFMKKHGELVMRIDDVVELRNEEMKHQYVPVLTFAIDQESIEILESVGESVDTHYADLRMLLLTAYGYEVLESLAMGTTCGMKTFSKVADSLSTLGFNIITVPELEPYSFIGWRSRRTMKEQGFESPEPKINIPSKFSSEMIEYIWQLTEFRNSILGE